MLASRWSRPIITRRCTVLICCANPNPASRASGADEARRYLSGRAGRGHLGFWLRREPAGARRIVAGADDGDALCDCRAAVPFCAPAERALEGADRDQRHVVSWPVPGAVI